MAFLCVKVIFLKDGRFSSIHIHDSEDMKKRKIHCVMDQDREMRTKNILATEERIGYNSEKPAPAGQKPAGAAHCFTGKAVSDAGLQKGNLRSC